MCLLNISTTRLSATTASTFLRRLIYKFSGYGWLLVWFPAAWRSASSRRCDAVGQGSGITVDETCLKQQERVSPNCCCKVETRNSHISLHWKNNLNTHSHPKSNMWTRVSRDLCPSCLSKTRNVSDKKRTTNRAIRTEGVFILMKTCRVMSVDDEGENYLNHLETDGWR